MNGKPIQVRQEARMGISESEEPAARNSGAGDLLYVTDLVSDNQDALEFACEVAEKRGAHLELLYVIDPEKASSRPDAQMGIQYSLEALARSLRNLKRNARARLLFGHPEDVISKRAAETKATLIAFPMDDSSSKRVQKALVRHLTRTCACPVLLFSAFSIIKMRNSLPSEVAIR
jgi:nucleotide-binding universal stress UspA family protein